MDALARSIDALLPQTQCTRCGYADCAAYADAIASGAAAINQCPPGGLEGIARLARRTGHAEQPLNPANGSEQPRALAVIDEAWCIGCTLCLAACPTDAIIGGNKRMHTVLEQHCTGCELCVPVCPVDCIAMETMEPPRTGWDAWSQAQADEARERYLFHSYRRTREADENDERLEKKAQAKRADLEHLTHGGEAKELARKRAVIDAALARAHARRNRSQSGD
ncbi:MAG: electron transport complex subunit RsxB [Proteobacteria bacterium]|nr:electron transport complex subunit RsxB [Pseudomonadota bacterium]